MLKISVVYPSDTASAAVRRLQADLRDKAALHAEIAPAVERLSRDHIAGEATFRHATADRLGGRPTGELGRAASKVSSKSDEAAATVQFGSPLLARAFRDVTIRPGAGKKYLTLPISGKAYGTRIRRFPGKLSFLRQGPNLVAVEKQKGRKIGTAHYLLVRQVRQKQDASLLPTDRAYNAASLEALTALILFRWQQ